ncbi:hypothetical protein CIHG_01200 [Coccidioides immitis H538.4]|uniref:Uncharacterized protein n=3 Tax=Coccidioides immitis TaxID=5501 RepID=A0A0J8QK88_COCIT|nr:hypothetical protein CIRG_01047 [Coccidioides immitis RMSCC 2394]KMU72856.1 hypothetical protein CISG_03291 [Coccidioides immitis RMSCC 3703]KMU83419.1 hypothetical protein CIHG_01200 [Coccidioides immitis H538.4]
MSAEGERASVVTFERVRPGHGHRQFAEKSDEGHEPNAWETVVALLVAGLTSTLTGGRKPSRTRLHQRQESDTREKRGHTRESQDSTGCSIDPSSLCSQECWPDIHHERADPVLLLAPPPSIQTFMKYNTLSLPLPQFSLWVGFNFDPLRSCEVDLAVNQTGAQD